jgi:hypothetical protein
MTKYVLNSGGAKNFPELKRKFHQELAKDLGESPKFLLCIFAQGREYWEAKFPGYSNSITEDMPEGVKPSFELAMPADFVEQCQKADIVYLPGGDDHLIKYWMGQYELPKIFSGKVVATSSASSDLLVSSYWTCDWRQCFDGFGILPIKFIPHYGSDWGDEDPRGPIDWQKAYDELAAYGDTTLPIHALKEGEYVVIEL